MAFELYEINQEQRMKAEGMFESQNLKIKQFLTIEGDIHSWAIML